MKKKDNLGIIIQARMSSKRLPGKILKKIGTKTDIQRVVETCQSVAPTIVAVAKEELDKDSSWISHIPGTVHIVDCPVEDVLARYYQTSKAFELDTVVRITADCPFISADLIRLAIAHHRSNKNDFTYYQSNISGLDVEVINFKALEITNYKARSSYEREHVTPLLYSLDFQGKYGLFASCLSKLSLDTKEDLTYLRKLSKELEKLEINPHP